MKQSLGPSVLGLKGKTVRKQRNGLESDVVPVPKHMHDYYYEIIVAINIMHVNQIPFLITSSRHVHYHTATVLPFHEGGHYCICALSILQVLLEVL